MKRTDYISWDEYFMGVALLTAQRSKDNTSQVGACIVSRENKILSMGYNGMPTGCDDDMPWEREGEPLKTKYMYVCHAELNAILNHASGTGSLKGARIYTTLFPCNECAKALIQSGISQVIYYEDKYALINEMFSDYIQEADRNYHDLQARNNPGGDGFIGYENLLECILQLFYNNIRFFSHSTPEENPYLFSVFFNHIFLSVDDYLQRHTGLAARYSTKEVAALLCNGFWGVISICHSEKMSREAVCERVKAMYNDILLSDLFRRK